MANFGQNKKKKEGKIYFKFKFEKFFKVFFSKQKIVGRMFFK